MYLLRRFPGGAIVGRFFEEREAVRLLQREAVPRQPELVVDGRVVDAPRPVLDVGRHEDLRRRRGIATENANNITQSTNASNERKFY